MQELEGTDVRIVTTFGNSYNGEVVGCDRDIGITIVDKEDKDHYIFCMTGPLSLQWKKADFPEEAKEQYFIAFDSAVSGIKKNVIYMGEIVKKSYSGGAGNASAEVCPFGQ